MLIKAMILIGECWHLYQKAQHPFTFITLSGENRYRFDDGDSSYIGISDPFDKSQIVLVGAYIPTNFLAVKPT